MCVQLNRLEYKEQDLFKHRHKVTIEKTMYLDRFLIENKTKSEQISNYVKKLRGEIKHLEASINQFTHFGGSEYDIRKMFGLMATFFTGQGQQISEDWKQLEGLKSYHPFKD